MAAAVPGSFGERLRSWRRLRGRSQLELAAIAGYSQRHLSFLESGRSRPSRHAVIVLSEALDVPLAARDEMLNAAGFAPSYGAEPLDGAQLTPAMEALQTILDSHAPFPALLVDRAWNTYATNVAAPLLFGLFTEDPAALMAESPQNALRACLVPAGLRHSIVDWPQFAAVMVAKLRHDALRDPRNATLAALIEAFELDPEFDRAALASAAQTHAPVALLQLERGDNRASLFTLVSTFGAPLDATLADLRIETFLPADGQTRTLLLALAEDASSPPR